MVKSIILRFCMRQYTQSRQNRGKTMKKVFTLLIFAFLIATFLGFASFGCRVRGFKPNPETVTSAKSQRSIFAVIETGDLRIPVLAASIRLPFRVHPNNSVILAGEHAYVTTENHLHVIDVSIPQRPSYLGSIVFPHQIGKVLVSGNYAIVSTPRKFHLLDVSQPSQLVLQSTVHLPQRNAIKDLDALDSHLYVMGENGHLYIYSVVFGQPRLVKTVKMSPRWWLFSPKIVRPDVKQILLPTSNTLPASLSEALLSRRGFLRLPSSKQEKVRASFDFLVQESVARTPTCDLLIYDAYRIGDFRIRSRVGYYDMEKRCLNHLSATGAKTLTRRKPSIAYAFNAGKIQQIAQDQLCETLDIDDRLIMGPVTDFQISRDLLYVINAKGFFSIIHLVKVEIAPKEDRTNFLSTTPLQACHPLSLAVGERYAYVLATVADSQR